MKTVPLGPYHVETGYTVVSACLSKLMGQEERSYQRCLLNSICGEGAMLKSSSQLLDIIQEMGQSYRSHKREGHHKVNQDQSL